MSGRAVGEPFPTLVEWGAGPSSAIPAGSWPFEVVFIQSQRCGCGGRFEAGAHAVVEGPRGALERHDARCARCGRGRAFWFDISSFHGDPRAHLRFEALRALCQEGLDQVEAGELEAAHLRFSEVAAREPWFGLARYHLGMIALVHEDLCAARAHLSAAAGLLPMDPNVHRALADCWALADEPERAARRRDLAAALDALVDSDMASE